MREPIDDANAGALLSELTAGPMPVGSFYVRSNFGVPTLDTHEWRLTVDGEVEQPLSLTVDDLAALGEETELVVLECAGNGRLLMEPVPSGTPWGLGGVSVAEFTGVPLNRVLAAARPGDVVDWVFTGADRGTVEPEGEINYQFSLHDTTASSPGPQLVWAMNGEPLLPEHGAPLRLIVPGGYGMQSVKWLTRITGANRSFDGHFRRKYRYYEEDSTPDGENVAAQRVRALITQPADGDDGPTRLTAQGIAWSGDGAIERVEISVDGGEWTDAELGTPHGRFGPTPWRVELDLSEGLRTIRARASDASGAVQPVTPRWNRNGYGNNVVHTIAIEVNDS
jgi:DMSO/TMAO reductase YedYZ molybdopterin-dependent catalytic subunit